MDAELIRQLAALRGLGDAYHDYRGELRYFSLETKSAILEAMGCKLDDAAALGEQIRALEAQRSRNLLPPIAAARGKRIGVDLNITGSQFGSALVWNLKLEDGSSRQGALSTADCPETWRGESAGAWITRRRFELPIDLPPGYHELQAQVGGGPMQSCLLILSEPACYEPPAIAAGGRLWGVAVQLYTVRSRDNWGIGDFQDLGRLIRWLAPLGAGFIGVNPLHALSPAEPERSSPYSASSRHFLNVLYISVPAVPEFSSCDAAQQRMADPEFAARLAQLREAPLVDYKGVADAKFELLKILHSDFHKTQLVHGGARAERFRAFVTAGGDALRKHASFDALDRHLRGSLGTHSGWMSWPHKFHDPSGGALRRYAAEHSTDVEFFVYLQWLAHEQLMQAQGLARELGMPIGIYGDYAVGASASGSETWVDRTSYRLQAEIGAPPDALALNGQGWGIPPPDPLAMQNERLRGFIRLIRANMRYYGALRLDHVMSLFRLWWVPPQMSPLEGAYVHYPVHQLLTVLALESQRNHCLVVGEDLGVVPDEMRVSMPQFGIYHYKVMLFEKNGAVFRKPGEYVRQALATVTTHDMPTLRGYWEGRDIELRTRLKLYPNAQMQAQVARERDEDRVALLAALRAQGLAPQRPATVHEPFTSELAQAMHQYLARSSAALASLQIEDLLGMEDPVNVPGTSSEYPNWQRKLSADVEDIALRADLAAALAEIDRARR